jgi:hypothetical protein
VSTAAPTTKDANPVKFLLRSNAYINVPTHLANDPPEFIRQMPTLVKAEPSAPTVLELSDDTSLDNISSKWEPLDDAAKDALARLDAKREQIRAAAKPRKEGVDELALLSVAARAPEAGTVLDQLKALPEAERAKVLAAIAADKTKAEADAATAGTMSGAIAKQGAAQKPKA